MAGQFPYDATKLLTGRHRILYAPTTVAVPTRISDIIDEKSPYTAQTGWLEVGATGAAADYAQNITKTGLDIQQTPETVKEEVSQVVRTFAFTCAETSTLLQVISEESPGVVTLTSASGKSAEKAVDFGSINDLTRYRIAILAMFKKADGLVTEPSGGTRGRWAGGVFYNCELDAGTYSQSFGEGVLRTIPITVKMFPDSTITTVGKETGRWLEETAGTIS